MDFLPYWVYELVYAIDQHEAEHPFPTDDNDVKCFYREWYKVPREHRALARQIVPYVEDAKNRTEPGTVSIG